MTGPEKLKSICFKCKVNKWIVDFKEGCAAKISATSVCLACEQGIKIDKLERALQEKDVKIKKMIDIVENLGKKIEALEKEKNQMSNDVDKNRRCESSTDICSNVQEKVNNMEKAVKENMDNIADNGKAIVELNNLVSESGFQKAEGRMVSKHLHRKSENTIKLGNRFAALSQEETCVIGDSIVKEQGDHFINRNKQRRRLKSYPGARVCKVIEEVKKLDKKSDRYVIVHAGSNDIYSRNNEVTYSEPVIKELESLVDSITEKTKKGIVVGILPRMYSSHLELSKAIGVNERTKKYCQRKGVEFLDVWSIFMDKRYFFKKDGIHLSIRGNIKLGEILNRCLEKFPSPSPVPEVVVEVEDEESAFLGFQ